MSEEINIQN